MLLKGQRLQKNGVALACHPRKEREEESRASEIDREPEEDQWAVDPWVE